MTQPEFIEPLVEPYDEVLLNEVYPLQKVLCEGIKLQLSRQLKHTFGDENIHDQVDIARSRYERKLAEWVVKRSAPDTYDEPCLKNGFEKAQELLSRRMLEIKSDVLSLFDLQPDSPETAVRFSENTYEKWLSHYRLLLRAQPETQPRDGYFTALLSASNIAILSTMRGVGQLVRAGVPARQEEES